MSKQELIAEIEKRGIKTYSKITVSELEAVAQAIADGVEMPEFIDKEFTQYLISGQEKPAEKINLAEKMPELNALEIFLKAQPEKNYRAAGKFLNTAIVLINRELKNAK